MDKSIVPVNQLAVRSSTGYEFSNPNQAVVVEIEDDPVEDVEKQMEDLKLNYQFNEQNVPQIFQTLINEQADYVIRIDVKFNETHCTMHFDEKNEICIEWKKRKNDWIISAGDYHKPITTVDPEKSIIDHLCFVLTNPNIDPRMFRIRYSAGSEEQALNSIDSLSQKLDIEKVETLLQSMFSTLDHQIHTSISCEGFNEDTFLSMLKIVNPRTLTKIFFDISWKEEGNYQKLKDIFETEQWKQAEYITTLGIIIPLKIEDLFHCKWFHFRVEKLSPEIVLRGTKGFFNSAVHKDFHLFFKNKNVDIDAIIDFLRSGIDGSVITEIKLYSYCKRCYKIAKSYENVFLYFHDGSVTIRNYLFYI